MARSPLPNKTDLNKTEKRDLTAISADIKKDFIALTKILEELINQLKVEEKAWFSIGKKKKRLEIEAALTRLAKAITESPTRFKSISDLLNDKQDEEMSLQEALNFNRLFISKKETHSAQEVRKKLEALPMPEKKTTLLSLPDDVLALILANSGYHAAIQATRVNKRLNQVVSKLSDSNKPQDDSAFWQSETAIHFPQHLERQSIFKSQKPIKAKDFFINAYKQDYRALTRKDGNHPPNPKLIKWRRLVKENNLTALQLETITLDDLLVLDSTHTDLIGYAARNNNQAILDHFYAIADNKTTTDPELLFWAVRCNQIKKADSLLKELPGCINKTALDPRAAFDTTLLCLAARYGYIEMARLLHEKGANINQTNELNGPAPLHEACIAGHLEMVKLFVEELKADTYQMYRPSSVDSTLYTSLDAACAHSQSQIVHYLLTKTTLKDVRRVFILSARNYAPSLHLACQRGSIDTVKVLLTTTPETSKIPMQPYSLQAIQEAYQHSYRPIIKYWLLKIELILQIRKLKQDQALSAAKKPAVFNLDLFSSDSSKQIDPAQQLLDALNHRKSIKNLIFTNKLGNPISPIYKELLKLDLEAIWKEIGNAPYDGLCEYYADSTIETKTNETAPAIEAPRKS